MPRIFGKLNTVFITKQYNVLDNAKKYGWRPQATKRVEWGSMIFPEYLMEDAKKMFANKLDGNIYNVYICDASYGATRIPGISDKEATDCQPVWEPNDAMVSSSLQHLYNLN